jgi:uncharacterized protein involved in response to NO
MLIQIEAPAPQHPAKPAFALFALAFRPFYLVAALFAVLAIVWWWVELRFGLSRPSALPGTLWHAHEMVFGFATAVVAGFLLTAVQTWTGIAAPSGKYLAVLVGAWFAGRLAMWWYSPLSVWIDLLFIPLVAAALLRVLVKADNRRNYFLVLLLAVLFLCNATFHVLTGGLRTEWSGTSAVRAVHAALFVMVVMITVIGGRVMPMFTANAVKGVRQFKSVWLDRLTILMTVIGLSLFVAQIQVLSALVLFLAAFANAIRLAGWGALASGRKPILWILHLSYAWIPAGLVLLALSALGWVSASAAMHALAVGAVSGMMLGMMTRTSRGHTGRVLQAGKAEVLAYVCIHLGTLARVLAAFSGGGGYWTLIFLAAVFWLLAFTLFVAKFTVLLVMPRLDGKPG